MTKSQKVLITLKPLKPYFFGGEQTFGPPGDRSNYFAKSRKLPQQTTLLGMLRYELLALKGLLNNKDKKKANLIIGGKSFNGEVEDFGLIEKLSALFLMKKNTPYLPLPKAHFYGEKNVLRNYDLHVLGTPESPSAFMLRDDKGNNYTAKNHFAEAWINTEDEKEVIKESKIFQSSDKVGIRKTKTGKTEEHAFFKQRYYAMVQDWKMAFILSFKTDDEVVCNFFSIGQKHQVELGGEGSVFLMEIKSAVTEPTLPQGYPRSTAYQKLILKSDAYVKDLSALYDRAVFSITEPVSFRNIRSSNSDKKDFRWSKLDRSGQENKTAPYKSGLHFLLSRGAIFFCENAEAFSAHLRHSAFQKIGYNQFDIIHKNEK